MDKKILIFILTIFISLNIFITNASWWSISLDYSNYNGNQSLKISGTFDAKIDQILAKKFEENDYYNQFRLIKDLSNKVVTLSKKSNSQKPLFDELKNYLSLKWDLLHKVSLVDTNEEVKEVKTTFKNAIKLKWTTLNTVVNKVNATEKVEITNKNNNFEILNQKDFEKVALKLVNDSKVNKYKTYDEILNDSKIITVDDFKKIKSLIPSSYKFTDEFGNDVKWEIETRWYFKKYYANNNIISIFNKELSSFENLKKDDLVNSNILWLWEVYQVFQNDDKIYNLLSKVQKIKNVDSDNNIEIISNNKRFIIWINWLPVLKYWNKLWKWVLIQIFFDKNWNAKYYLDVWFNDYIFLWKNKDWKKEYMEIDYYNKQIKFWTILNNLGQDVDTWVKFTQSQSNINILFEDWKKISTTWWEYNLDDFKSIISKKITRINIDWTDMNSWLLLNKSIIDLYK